MIWQLLKINKINLFVGAFLISVITPHFLFLEGLLFNDRDHFLF